MFRTIHFGILILVLFLWTGCSKKKHNPFCFECEEGTLVIHDNLPGNAPQFAKDNGDTVAIVNQLDASFVNGSRVCIKLREAKLVRAVYLHPAYEAKCIREL